MRAEDLEILNQANRLLNRKQIRLGLKPRMVTSVLPDLYQQKLKQVIDQNIEAREQISAQQMQIQEELAQTEERIENFQKEDELLVEKEVAASPVTREESKESNLVEIFSRMGRFLPYVLVFLFLAAIAIFMFYQSWAEKNAFATKRPVYSAEELDKPVYISAGTYKSRGEASIASKKVARVTGESTRVVQSGKFYTVQIGAGYDDHDDAYLVFEELIKYPLADLSIRQVDAH